MFTIPSDESCGFSKWSYLGRRSSWAVLEISLGLYDGMKPGIRRMRPARDYEQGEMGHRSFVAINWQDISFVVIQRELSIYSLEWKITLCPKVDSDYSQLIPRKVRRCS